MLSPCLLPEPLDNLGTRSWPEQSAVRASPKGEHSFLIVSLLGGLLHQELLAGRGSPICPQPGCMLGSTVAWLGSKEPRRQDHINSCSYFPQVVARGLGTAVVFEDDVRFEGYFKERLQRLMEELEWAKLDWDLMYADLVLQQGAGVELHTGLSPSHYPTGAPSLIPWPPFPCELILMPAAVAFPAVSVPAQCPSPWVEGLPPVTHAPQIQGLRKHCCLGSGGFPAATERGSLPNKTVCYSQLPHTGPAGPVA